jgi:hypothetical protein
MQQAIVLLIKKSEGINKIRKRYDPFWKKYRCHLTLVYRFRKKKASIIDKHIKDSIKLIKPFQITFRGYGKSVNEHYLYFLIKRGRDNIIKLHKKLNFGILKHVKNKKMPKYLPHISLGVFKTKKQIDQALKQLPKIQVNEKVDRIQLLTLDKNRNIKSIKTFKLK